MEKLFDSHFHIIDPRFPLVLNNGFLPRPFSCADYRSRAAPLGVVGGAVVSGSFQAFDQHYLKTALKALGPSYVGVAQLPASAPDAEIRALDAAGVRAVRFNLRRGGSAAVEELMPLADRVYELAGWHAELYVDARDLTGGLFDVVASLPAVSIDHLGLSRAGFPTLLRLAERGAYVKATGFGRLDFDPRPALRDLAAANPNGLLFGTDLPSTRAARPFRDEDVALVRDALSAEDAKKALYANAAALYQPSSLEA